MRFWTEVTVVGTRKRERNARASTKRDMRESDD